MPATPQRIGFIQQEFRHAVAISQEAKDRHGTLARESDDPIETYFDSEDDAETLAIDRQSLLSPERRCFAAEITDIESVLAMTYIGAAPVATFVDSERGETGRKVIVSEVIINFETAAATYKVWG